jgi:hypothetical protein
MTNGGEIADQNLTIKAVREAQLIMSNYIEPGPKCAETTVEKLLDVLDRDEIVEAVDRLEDANGLRET